MRPVAGIVLLGVGLMLVCVAASAPAAKTQRLHALSFDGDIFYNFDFNSDPADTSRGPRSRRVDWPVDFLFTNKAEIDIVKGRFRANNKLEWQGGKQYAYLYDNNGPRAGQWTTDGDKGIKSAKCSFLKGNGPLVQKTLHMRLYGVFSSGYDSRDWDKMYNTKWGFYVIGTSHYDYAECTTSATFGNSEWAENRIANIARGVFGRRKVWEDRVWMDNLIPAAQVNDHIWRNNGAATRVLVFD